MAKAPTSTVDTSSDLSADMAAENAPATAAKVKRDLGPKTVYVQLAEGTPKDVVLSIHTNTRTLVDSIEANPGSSYVKMVLPQGEPRGPKKS